MMTNHGRQHLIVALGVLLFTGTGAIMPASGQQNQPALQITSPATGVLVNPGQTIQVSVSSPTNTAFTKIILVGEFPIGMSDVATSLPAQFSVVIPSNSAPRKFKLTASGFTTSGQEIESTPIFLDVERPDLPTKMTSMPGACKFKTQGEKLQLQIWGTFSDGSYLDVTRSSYLAFSSSNTSVTTVDATGLVTAVATGSASVKATYVIGSQSTQVSVRVTVPAPLLTTSPTSINFGTQAIGTTSPAQSITVSNVSNASISVLAVAATGYFSETDNCVSSSPLAVGAACTISAAFTPTIAASKTGSVDITNDFTVAQISIPLSGTGIGQQPTTDTVASSANPSVFGQAVVFTTTVSPSSGIGTPTGSVTFSDGTNSIGSVTLASGQAIFSTSSLSVGTHSITASYGGDANFLPSTSSALSQVVNQASTTTRLTSSTNPSTLNASITLTANLGVMAPGAGTPTGSISFQDGSNVLATVPVGANGQALFSSTSLLAGSHSLTASYSGDTNFKVSSGSLTEQVAYAICVLYDQTRSVNSGATFPIKLYLCDVSGNDVSSSSTVLHATGITSVSSSSGPVESPGSANPDNDFRYDSTQGPSGGYIFNLSTSGLATGTYSLQFTAGADPTVHAVNFGVK